VWPESAIDRDPSHPRGAPLWALAAEAADASGLLLAGVSLDGPDRATQRIVGAVLLDAAGERDRYVKRRPVPFGEYVPARRWLGRIPALDQVPRDAVAGPGPQAVEIAPGISAAVAVCFETLFGWIVRTNLTATEEAAGIVLAITNDASFRDSAEPAQHLAQSRLRAVETGRWVVHAALSGSSAFVDPDGGVHDRTELFTQAVIRRDVPLAAGPTPYLRTGDVLGWLGAALLGATLLHGIFSSLRPRRRTSPGPRRPAA